MSYDCFTHRYRLLLCEICPWWGWGRRHGVTGVNFGVTRMDGGVTMVNLLNYVLTQLSAYSVISVVLYRLRFLDYFFVFSFFLFTVSSVLAIGRLNKYHWTQKFIISARLLVK